MIFATLLNYGIYSRSKNLERSLAFTSFVQLFCFSWGVVAAGSLSPEHIVYLPLFPVINGFIFGKRGAIFSAIYGSLLCLGVFFIHQKQAVLCFQAISSTFFSAFMVTLYELARKSSEAKMLESEKKLELALAIAKEKETAYREVFENVPVGLCELNTSFHFANFNPALSKMLGYSREELMKLTMPEITHPDDIKHSKTAAVKAMNPSEGITRHQKRYFHKSGRIVWVRVTAHRLKNHENGEAKITGMVEDITDELRLIHEEEAHRTEAMKAAARFSTMFESTPNPILVFGKDGILDCNLAAIRILGAPDKNSVLSKHPAVFSPEIQPDGRTSGEKAVEMDALAQKHGKHQFEWTHKKFDGTEFPAEVTLSPIDWNDEKALLVLWNDLTEKKQRDMQIVQTSKLASLGEMAAGIAHEINNPLAIISGSVGLLKKYIDQPEKLTSKIESIEKSSDRISKIVTGLRKFSRSGDSTQRQLLPVQNIVNEVLILTEAKSKRHHTSVHFECQSDAKIHCDEVEIEQVLVNLINNAIDAVKKRDEKWVKIKLFTDEREVVLQVIDSGLGIPEKIRTKIFDPFFTTKITGEGTGIGLSITKGILDEHKASIKVLSHLPNTCFEIRFPINAESKTAA